MDTPVLRVEWSELSMTAVVAVRSKAEGLARELGSASDCHWMTNLSAVVHTLCKVLRRMKISIMRKNCSL